MCHTCYMSKCPSGCPNAPAPPRVTTCAKCGCSITPGDEYARIDGLDYCEGCIDEMTYSEVIELLGGEWKTASEEDIYDGYDG